MDVGSRPPGSPPLRLGPETLPDSGSIDERARDNEPRAVSTFPGIDRSAAIERQGSRKSAALNHHVGIDGRPRDGGRDDHGACSRHPVPKGITVYVQLLRSWPVRTLVILLWLTFLVVGASIYFPLAKVLKISVEPPYGSDSEAAKKAYLSNFPPEAVTMVALLSANVPKESNASLINPEAEMYTTFFPPFFGYDPTANLTAEAEAISSDLKSFVKPHLDRCVFNFYSFFDYPFEVQMVAHELLFPSRLAGKEGLVALHMVSCDGHAIYKECVYKEEPFCEPVAELLESWAAYRLERSEDKISLQFVSYPNLYEDIILGIELGMALSTVATALAFIVLAVMLRNIRQLGLVLANILCAIGTTLLIMYPISYYVMDVNVCAPAMLVAVALAMSIDYSLFLLTRFNDELASGLHLNTALEIALSTQGHTIIVSGVTLALCFTAMLALPTSTITSMAVGAATAVIMSVLVSLSLTPSLLLSFPFFFTNNRRFGLTFDGTLFGRNVISAAPKPIKHRKGGNASMAAPGGRPAVEHMGLWPTLGRFTQVNAKVVAVLLLIVAAPFALALTYFRYVEDISPLMQSTHPATTAFRKLGDTFGQDLITPVLLLILAPSAETMSTREWSLATCHMLQGLAGNVTAEMARRGFPEYVMKQSDFSGLMILNGGCIEDGMKWGMLDVMPAVYLSGAFDMVTDLLSNKERTATQVVVHCQVDLFSRMGEAWMRSVRAVLPRDTPPPEKTDALPPGTTDRSMDPMMDPSFDPSVDASIDFLQTNNRSKGDDQQLVDPTDPSSLSSFDEPLARPPYAVYEGVDIGALHLYGMPLEQMDGANYTLQRMPMVAMAIAGIVCIILGGSFGALMIPIRAVVCIGWMLVVTFGAAVMVYQFGYLEGLGIKALSPAAGNALFWISPSVCVAILVGLGLDYDIFLMDSVIEHRKSGKGGKEAVVAALDQAGNIISAAGIIMFLAFGALGASTTPVLNQIGFMLCLGVLIDCFITTKITIPCLMALVNDDVNFWPLEKPPASSTPALVEPAEKFDIEKPHDRSSQQRRSLRSRWRSKSEGK